MPSFTTLDVVGEWNRVPQRRHVRKESRFGARNLVYQVVRRRGVPPFPAWDDDNTIMVVYENLMGP